MTAHLEPSPLALEVEYLRAEIASLMRLMSDSEERFKRLAMLAERLDERVKAAEKGGGK